MEKPVCQICRKPVKGNPEVMRTDDAPDGSPRWECQYEDGSSMHPGYSDELIRRDNEDDGFPEP